MFAHAILKASMKYFKSHKITLQSPEKKKKNKKKVKCFCKIPLVD